ncbi:hypothetical protein FRB94_013596 [Tulasnella sp. JGI-2019a]|nr:hypothetical protein FRB94_013596 [Tulasnella sp. JGI-2019a]
MTKARKAKAPGSSENTSQPVERSDASGSKASSPPLKRKRIPSPPPQLDPDAHLDEEEDEEEDAGRTKRPRSSAPDDFPTFESRATITVQPVVGPSRDAQAAIPYIPRESGPTGAAVDILRAFGVAAPVFLAPDAKEEAELGLKWKRDGSELDIDNNAGPDQHLELARFFQEEQANFGQNATVVDALRNLGLETLGQLLPGLDVRLLPHQYIGVSWMLTKERNKREKGGILADDMGLGKTVQAIALMAANPPDLDAEDQREDRRKSTLVVAPAALLDQWKDEIETKADMFRVFIHHGTKKAKTIAALRKYDVVITSYHTLHYEFNPRTNKDTTGPIAQTKWYRIILDEAQIIRNRTAQISASVARLNSTYRWCLTGTPFTNGLNDLYPLLRFARLRPWNDWESFATHIGSRQFKDAEAATGKMAAIVKKHLLRRKKTDQLEGKPILQLKKKTIEIEFVDFTPEERRIYKSVLLRQQMMITKFLRAGTLLKNYKYILVMILRLRQVCCHPQLIAYAANDIANEDAERVLAAPGIEYDDDDNEGQGAISDLPTAIRVMGLDMVKRLKEQFRTREIERLVNPPQDGDEEGTEAEDAECPICFDMMANPCITMCGHQFCRDCVEGLFTRQVEYANDDGGVDTRPCPACRQNVRQDQLFKSTLFEPSVDEIKKMGDGLEKEKDGDQKKDMAVFDLTLENSDDDLPSAHELFNPKEKPKKEKREEAKEKRPRKMQKKRIASVSDGSDDGAIEGTLDDEAIYTPSKKVKKGVVDVKGKGKQKAWSNSSSVKSFSDSDSSSDLDQEDDPKAFRPGMLNAMQDFQSSAKMQKMVDLLKQWMDNDPDDKVIIYSQWIKCLDMLEGALQRDEIRCIRYDGSMNRQDRSAAVKRFKKKGSAHVLLVSTKCGSVGLNLTEANRVINFDPAWNFASESQAYDRVHRIGQQKEVVVKRLIVRDSIEERILRIQGGKQDLVDAALGEGQPGRLQRLRIKDILKLFGM